MDPNFNALRINVAVKPECKRAFAEWQASLHSAIITHEGFVSLEIAAASAESLDDWVIVQRFGSDADARAWSVSGTHNKLLAQLKPLAVNEFSIIERAVPESKLEGGITEVFVTQVRQEQETAFKAWSAKIHAVEATFPGFIGVYVQSPVAKKSKHWITLLKFDTPEHLDNWLQSDERKETLKEAKELITSLEDHRLLSAYAGWFTSLAKTEGPPPVWKQTMLVLLVLFPIVMLEYLYLMPNLAAQHISPALFIGNAISVILIAWPCMPLAIFYLRWWLKPNSNFKVNLAGVLLLLLLYLSEIIFFWWLI